MQNIDFDDDEDDYNDVDDGDGIVTLLFQCISHFSFTSIILIQIQQLWQVYSTYQFLCSTTIFPLSQMNLPIRYQYGECSSAHPVTAIQAWTIAPLILEAGSSNCSLALVAFYFATIINLFNFKPVFSL